MTSTEITFPARMPSAADIVKHLVKPADVRSTDDSDYETGDDEPLLAPTDNKVPPATDDKKELPPPPFIDEDEEEYTSEELEAIAARQAKEKRRLRRNTRKVVRRYIQTRQYAKSERLKGRRISLRQRNVPAKPAGTFAPWDTKHKIKINSYLCRTYNTNRNYYGRKNHFATLDSAESGTYRALRKRKVLPANEITQITYDINDHMAQCAQGTQSVKFHGTLSQWATEQNVRKCSAIFIDLCGTYGTCEDTICDIVRRADLYTTDLFLTLCTRKCDIATNNYRRKEEIEHGERLLNCQGYYRELCGKIKAATGKEVRNGYFYRYKNIMFMHVNNVRLYAQPPQ